MSTMMLSRWLLSLAVFLCGISGEGSLLVSAFSPIQPKSNVRQRSRAVTSLYMSDDSSAPTLKTAVIEPDSDDFNLDPGQGGVRLAQESALCLVGLVPHASTPTKANAQPVDLIRYTHLTPIESDADIAKMESVLKQQSATIVASAEGVELYKDPGPTTEQTVALAPQEAAKNLLAALEEKSASTDKTMDYLVNIVGGSDLQVLEVMSALGQLRLGLEKLKIAGISKKTDIGFSSLSHPSFPLGRVTMTLIAIPTDASIGEQENGFENAVARGDVFVHQGKYLTLLQDNINSAVE